MENRTNFLYKTCFPGLKLGSLYAFLRQKGIISRLTSLWVMHLGDTPRREVNLPVAGQPAGTKEMFEAVLRIKKKHIFWMTEPSVWAHSGQEKTQITGGHFEKSGKHVFCKLSLKLDKKLHTLGDKSPNRLIFSWEEPSSYSLRAMAASMKELEGPKPWNGE